MGSSRKPQWGRKRCRVGRNLATKSVRGPKPTTDTRKTGIDTEHRVESLV